jgi:hypothetical protein
MESWTPRYKQPLSRADRDVLALRDRLWAATFAGAETCIAYLVAQIDALLPDVQEPIAHDVTSATSYRKAHAA